jgi:hypothetical protein
MTSDVILLLGFFCTSTSEDAVGTVEWARLFSLRRQRCSSVCGFSRELLDMHGCSLRRFPQLVATSLFKVRTVDSVQLLVVWLSGNRKLEGCFRVSDQGFHPPGQCRQRNLRKCVKVQQDGLQYQSPYLFEIERCFDFHACDSFDTVYIQRSLQTTVRPSLFLSSDQKTSRT